VEEQKNNLLIFYLLLMIFLFQEGFLTDLSKIMLPVKYPITPPIKVLVCQLAVIGHDPEVHPTNLQ
jgi:hypothetical protein